MALPTKYTIEKSFNSMAGLSAYENGGKGSGNFGHAGRPGEVGGSASEGAYYTDGDAGIAPLIIDEKDGRYSVKSLSDEASTKSLLAADSTLSKVGEIAYKKSLRGETPTDQQKMVLQAITGARQLLAGKVREMGEAMTFKDTKLDFEDFDRAMSHADEFMAKARMKMMGDDSKVGKILKTALTSVSNVSGILKMLADPDTLKRHDEPQWYDIDDLIQRTR